MDRSRFPCPRKFNGSGEDHGASEVGGGESWTLADAAGNSE